MQTPAIYMLCGCIGCGKTTYARKLASERKAFILSNDQFTVGIFGNDPGREILDRYIKPIETLQLKLCDQLLSLGISAVFDNGFWTRQSRDKLRDYGQQHNVPVYMIYLTAPESIMRERASARTQQMNAETFFINGEIWDELRPIFEPPMIDEVYQSIATG